MEDWQRVKSEVLQLFDETFTDVQGIYLDGGTSFFETLGEFDAARASRPVGARCATIAAQVAHVTYYLGVLGRYMRTGSTGDTDWNAAWQSVSAVSNDDWLGLVAALRRAHDEVRGTLADDASWAQDACLPGALAVVVHSAYHLGEVRQALCTLG